MFGLPSDFTANAFLGRVCNAVTFTANTIHLQFDEDVGLTLEASFSHRPRGARSLAEQASVPVLESRLMQLVGTTVSGVEVPDEKTLILCFDDGEVLCCLDDSTQYESFRIAFDGREIVV